MFAASKELPNRAFIPPGSPREHRRPISTFRRRLANWCLLRPRYLENSGLADLARKIETGIPPFFSLCFPREKTTTPILAFCCGAISPSFFLFFVRCRIRLRRLGSAGPSAADGPGACSCRHKSRNSKLVGGAHAGGD